MDQEEGTRLSHVCDEYTTLNDERPAKNPKERHE